MSFLRAWRTTIPKRGEIPESPSIMLVREVVLDPDVRLHAAAAMNELISGVDAKCLEASELRFSDGRRGALLEMHFDQDGVRVVRMQALRIDDDLLTTATFSTAAMLFDEGVRHRYVRSLKSVAV
jgi:hypothetical protein